MENSLVGPQTMTAAAHADMCRSQHHIGVEKRLPFLPRCMSGRTRQYMGGGKLLIWRRPTATGRQSPAQSAARISAPLSPPPSPANDSRPESRLRQFGRAGRELGGQVRRHLPQCAACRRSFGASEAHTRANNRRVNNTAAGAEW